MPHCWAPASWLGYSLPCVGDLGSFLIVTPLTGICWDGFRGARVIALPGSPAYALNHGVYLTDAQVLPLGPVEPACQACLGPPFD